jgi:hypothetical protein
MAFLAGAAIPELGFAQDIEARGTVVGWGGQVVGVAPAGLFTQVAAGWYHSLVLKSDGSIVAWGRNVEGQTHVPAPNSSFVAIAAGGDHSLALRADRDSDTVADVLDNCPNEANPLQEDVDGDEIGDACDACPASQSGDTIVIDKCDTGIANDGVGDGCTRADRVAACAAGADDHGQFVQCVARLGSDWRRSGVVSDADRGRLMRCAARAALPPSDDE